ncbi:FAD-dependent oxidoreductase [Parvularcula sp. LCG005]|uniref:FAD-dependent oxidoreductase n=1 Tax=Parvularcula sp. LCG005 TaxID=3078805 RepID=UPI00294323EB|nr:FAD-dependent oxidoreductase [Parvularcula sp. LCG005]WOI53823.1 FAD-dependent oxidoreductase [Parvularcula sp. LCG005]
MPPKEVNYTFDDKELEQLKAFGEVRSHQAGDILSEEGEACVDCLITLSGESHIFVGQAADKKRVGFMERGQFAGDLTVLTGQASLSRVIMGEDGDILHIAHSQFKRLLVENSHLSDVFVRVLTARREFGRQSQNGGIIVIGENQDRHDLSIRQLLDRHGIPHTALSARTDPLAQQMMSVRGLEKSDLPAVLRGTLDPLVKPSIEELSAAFGLDLLPDEATADVAVIGAGPAGLAASVYAASEGLDVVTLDAEAPGGQAGTSSKIENYLGFPSGVSGRELAERASIQAQKFGVRLASPVSVKALSRDDDAYCLTLGDDRHLRARAIVVATGAQYRRLPIEDLERFEGRGIHYGATPMEAQLCGQQSVAVIGAGNSAGQGAVFLSETAKEVHIVYRRADIRETMSEYLVRRLEELPNVHFHPSTELKALHGVDGADEEDDHLTAVTWENSEDGSEERCDTSFIFMFVGAVPCTDWLPDTMSCDENGFLKTGDDLKDEDLEKANWPLERAPTRYETSWPRIYAVGDVRTRSVKRVASAVGEGSVVVSDIHAALSETNQL